MKKELKRNTAGVFFDLYGTLLIYGDMKSAWADWLKAFYDRLCLHGLAISMESFSNHCDRFFGKEEPPGENDGFTVFERRIHCLTTKLSCPLRPDEVAGTANYIAGVWQKHVRLDEEAATVLSILHSHKTLGLVSNYDHPPYVKKLIADYGLGGFFQTVVISGDVGVKKPDPRIFDPALRQTGLRPCEVAYIGDTEEDMAAAWSAGMMPVWIQRWTHGTDRSALDFTADENPESLTQENHVGTDVTRVVCLKELVELFV